VQQGTCAANNWPIGRCGIIEKVYARICPKVSPTKQVKLLGEAGSCHIRFHLGSEFALQKFCEADILNSCGGPERRGDPSHIYSTYPLLLML